MHVQIRCKQEAILGDAAGEFAQPQVVPLRYQCTLAVLTNALCSSTRPDFGERFGSA